MPPLAVECVPAFERHLTLPRPDPKPWTETLRLAPAQGKDGSLATAASLRKAADILQESFDPIIDLSTGQDLLPVMVFAQELGAWDYTGMYTILLKHQARPRCPTLLYTCSVLTYNRGAGHGHTSSPVEYDVMDPTVQPCSADSRQRMERETVSAACFSLRNTSLAQ